MTTFLLYPEGTTLILTLGLALAVIGQAVAFVHGYYRHEEILWKRYNRNVLEVAILLQTLMMASLFAQGYEQIVSGYLLEPSWQTFRYVLFVAVLVPVVIDISRLQNWSLLALPVVTGMTLPMVEAEMPMVFPLLFMMTMFYFIVRAIHMIFRCQKEFKTGISASSIHIAIDSLPTALLFYRRNGSVLLMNSGMAELMNAMAGKIYRNGEEFFRKVIVEGVCLPQCERVEMEGEIVYRLSDRRVWKFTTADLHLGRRTYVQLSASDVTDQWEMIQELQRQSESLKEKGEKLKEAIVNIREICFREESLRMKNRFHDVLGQRIALLLRSLREDKIPDETLLADFAEDFLKKIGEDDGMESAESQLLNLKRTMEAIGVVLHLSGELPEEREIVPLCGDILVEATTNAVRHGLATDIYIHGEQCSGAYHMTIRNNGISPREAIVEGGGIGQMRSRIDSTGGSLHISWQPEFQLAISIPGGGKSKSVQEDGGGNESGGKEK